MLVKKCMDEKEADEMKCTFVTQQQSSCQICVFMFFIIERAQVSALLCSESRYVSWGPETFAGFLKKKKKPATEKSAINKSTYSTIYAFSYMKYWIFLPVTELSPDK